MTQFDASSAEYTATHHDSGRAPVNTGEQSMWWVGWIAFAGTMMVLLGSFHVIEGLIALFRDEVFLVGESGLIVNVDYTAWGWAHIVMGAIAVLAGIGVLRGNMAARIIGVFIALISAVVNLAFITAYPLWSTIMIAVDVLVIMALTVHGSAVKSLDD